MYLGVQLVGVHREDVGAVSERTTFKKCLETDIIADQVVHIGVSYSYITNRLKYYRDGILQWEADCRPCENLLNFSSVGNYIQGVAYDAPNIYTIDAAKVTKHTADGTVVSSFDKPADPHDADHYGDGVVVGTYLYIPFATPDWDNATDTGVMRIDISDMSLDTTFGTDGYLSLKLDLWGQETIPDPITSASAITYENGFFYVSGYFDGKIYKYNSDFSTLIETYTIDDSIVLAKSALESTNFSARFDGITYDSTRERFFLNYHGYLTMSINANFDNDSIVYYRLQSTDSASPEFIISCQGLEWVETDNDGNQTFIIADRNIGDGTQNGVRKIKMLSASTDNKLYPFGTGVYLGNDANGSSTTQDYQGTMQYAYMYGYAVTDQVMSIIYHESDISLKNATEAWLLGDNTNNTVVSASLGLDGELKGGRITSALHTIVTKWDGSSQISALNFDGTNDYVEMPALSCNGTGSFSISAQVMIDESSLSRNYNLFSKDTWGLWRLYLEDAIGCLRFYIRFKNDGLLYYDFSDYTFPLQTQVKISVYVNLVTHKTYLYVNDKFKQAVDISTDTELYDFGASPKPFYICDDSDFWKGTIADIKYRNFSEK